MLNFFCDLPHFMVVSLSFITLPFGVEKEADVKFGNDPGCSKNPNLRNKYLLVL